MYYPMLNLCLLKKGFVSACKTLLFASLLISAGCGYQLRGTADRSTNNDLHALTLTSSDPYGPMTRAVRQQLLLSNVTIVEDPTRTDLPSLRIISVSNSEDTVSIFRDGKTAERQITMILMAQLLLPGQDIHPLRIKVFRSFFDNPLTALGKDTEQELLQQEMRIQAAQRLIRKMLATQTTAQSPTKKNDNSQSIDSNQPTSNRVTL